MLNLSSSSKSGPTSGQDKPQTVIQFEQAPDFDNDDQSSFSMWDNFSRKFKEQPLVPLGVGATTIALLGAGRAIQRGESHNFNIWCRYRVVFQSLTVAAALGGSLYYNKERNEAQRVKEEEREKMRIYQRDLRIRSQEINSHSNHLPTLNPSNPDLEVVSDTHKSLFSNQNSQIRKALLERKLSDQHKHTGSSLTATSDKK